MTKGTPSMGLRNKHSHIICRRCGKQSFHARHGVCSSCGFGKSSKIRGYSWTKKQQITKQGS